MNPPLILGTAEFNPEGYNKQPRVNILEIKRILSCAKEAGINIIDTAESYNCQEIIKKFAKGFCIYTKTRDWKVTLNWGDNELRGILYHYVPNEPQVKLPYIHKWVNLGVSIYNFEQLPENKLRILQVPFNINNTQFQYCFNQFRTVFIRSIFGNGRLLKKYFIKDCIRFIKQQPIEGVIVGVRSVKELEEILKAYN